ncbi:MAG: hypothetical protein EOL97_12730 [Spirochaetia bacterium]|nr:hypothetical protein [Spirochaetia bacterium]
MSTNRKQNFIRIAEARTNKIINYIELLGNLSNQSYYEYNDKQIETIFDAIQNELDKQRSKFKKGNDKKIKFRL